MWGVEIIRGWMDGWGGEKGMGEGREENWDDHVRYEYDRIMILSMLS